jgi:hypothetical protein
MDAVADNQREKIRADDAEDAANRGPISRFRLMTASATPKMMMAQPIRIPTRRPDRRQPQRAECDSR